ncbi:hypothetical protein [Kineococcus esterisolvens]|uniref:hypothetical protein n=1 Tax=unclassified Kineococcus TaxID=2621656 RepID=UPI003D7EEE65
MADAPCFATPVQLIWRKRRWRCREQRCPTDVWSEEHPALPARAKLTARAVEWAVQTLRWNDSTVSALARQLGWGHLPLAGEDRHTLMDAIRTRAHQDLNDEPPAPRGWPEWTRSGSMSTSGSRQPATATGRSPPSST